MQVDVRQTVCGPGLDQIQAAAGAVLQPQRLERRHELPAAVVEAGARSKLWPPGEPNGQLLPELSQSGQVLVGGRGHLLPDQPATPEQAQNPIGPKPPGQASPAGHGGVSLVLARKSSRRHREPAKVGERAHGEKCDSG